MNYNIDEPLRFMINLKEDVMLFLFELETTD
jgi:hypothetical protein